jgi:OHCU decarboxylase
MLSLDELNALPAADAATRLRACCGSSRWVGRMVNARPFSSFDELAQAADAAWAGTGPEDWLEAFAAHPRIGDRSDSAWSKEEQGTAIRSGHATRARIAGLNEEYQRRFGHIYIVCATGKSGEEILDDLFARMANDRDTELRIAAREQHRITRLRLGKLIGVEEQ